jgi:hypothetical protein
MKTEVPPMPGKRSYFRRSLKSECPCCGAYLHRINSQKFRLYADKAEDIESELKVSRAKARQMALQGPVSLKDTWIEEFYCTDHGRMWLQVRRGQGENGYLTNVPPASVWKRTAQTIDPDHPNTSVSEFTLRNSRGIHHNLLHRFY